MLYIYIFFIYIYIIYIQIQTRLDLAKMVSNGYGLQNIKHRKKAEKLEAFRREIYVF